MNPPNADHSGSADDEPPFEPERIVETLARHSVEYMMVGGLAARLHGATRQTKDLDCLPQSNVDNLQRLATAMKELHARLRAEGLSDDESLQLTRHLPSPEFFRRGGISNWMTDAGPLDVMGNMPDRHGHPLTYDQLVDRSLPAVHAGITVRIAALDDIVASKEFADRDKDKEALPELWALQHQRDERANGNDPTEPPVPDPPAPQRGPSGRTLANGLDHPDGPPNRPHDRGPER